MDNNMMTETELDEAADKLLEEMLGRARRDVSAVMAAETADERRDAAALFLDGLVGESVHDVRFAAMVDGGEFPILNGSSIVARRR